VEVLATAVNEEDIRSEPTLRKEKRVALKDDKWLSVKTTMEKGLEKKYSEVSISETDLSTLSNTYELVQQNKAIVNHLQNWDMDDVFTLVTGFEANGVDAKTVDLLKEWPNTAIKDIKFSNTWYHTNTSSTVAPWVRQNLECSSRFIEDSCDEDMRAQLTDQLATYKASERGGPLTFKLLMDLVQVNSERAIKHLIGSVKTIDVKNFDGENIVEVVSQVRGAHSRLMMVSFGGAASAVPITFCEDVMDALATTSTPTFNEAFDYRKLRATTRLSGGGKTNYNVDQILEAALELYNEMMQDDSWLGVKSKAKETAFTAVKKAKNGKTEAALVSTSADGAPRKCFNCGGDHMLPQCKKPLDQERIKANKKKSFEARGTGGGGRGRGAGRGGRDGGRGRGAGRGTVNGEKTFKWAPPASHENNRRFITIEGTATLHKYNKEARRWEKDGSGGSVSTMTAATTNTSGSATTAANNRAALANLQQQLQQTFANLLSHGE
jgi:hypothetical protein